MILIDHVDLSSAVAHLDYRILGETAHMDNIIGSNNRNRRTIFDRVSVSLILPMLLASSAVYDLDDQHKGSFSVESNGHSVVLSPGRHVLITKHHSAEFAQINAVETISHRSVQSSIKNGQRIHHSEFSVISALDTVKPLRALASSKSPHARQIAQRMIKTTAIMLQLGGNAGQYQHYFKPSLTAMK